MSSHLEHDVTVEAWVEEFLRVNKGKKITRAMLEIWFKQALTVGMTFGMKLRAQVEEGGSIHNAPVLKEYNTGLSPKKDNSDCQPFADQMGGGFEEHAKLYEDEKEQVKEMKAEFEKQVANSPNSFKTPIFEDRLPDAHPKLEAPTSVPIESDLPSGGMKVNFAGTEIKKPGRY